MNTSRDPLNHPTKWAICSCCNGDGRVSNPAFSGGFTSEEWADMSHDYDEAGETTFAERYLRGDFDVACRECGASGKVRVPDMERMTYAQKRVLAGHRAEERARARYEAESAAEYEAERRMGA